jgi:hypothetical protein
MDEKILDLSIVFANINASLKDDTTGFYRLALVNDNMALVPRNATTSVHIENKICLDHSVFAQYIVDKHRDENQDVQPPTYEIPVEVDDQLKECTPQFILRNIPKIEHYYDLERPLPFSLDDLPIREAIDEFNRARNTHFDPPEFIDIKSLEIVNDFTVFLEEIFYLCPWEAITRHPPDELSPWHPKHSRSQLAKDLLASQNTLFIFSDKGMSKMGMKDYKPKEKKKSEEQIPSGGLGFATFGPG